MALVTNTERALTELALDGLGRERFTVTVCADEVARGKPEPDPYLRAAELLGVDAVGCLAVEDSPTGALAAGRAGAAVLVVPCDVPVPARPGQVHRESLIGLTSGDIRASYRWSVVRPRCVKPLVMAGWPFGRCRRDATVEGKSHPAQHAHRAQHDGNVGSPGRARHMTLERRPTNG